MRACVCVCKVVAVGFVLQSQAVQTEALMMTSAPSFLFGPFTSRLKLMVLTNKDASFVLLRLAALAVRGCSGGCGCGGGLL